MSLRHNFSFCLFLNCSGIYFGNSTYYGNNVMIRNLLYVTGKMILSKNKKPRNKRIQTATQIHFDSRLQSWIKKMFSDIPQYDDPPSQLQGCKQRTTLNSRIKSPILLISDSDTNSIFLHAQMHIFFFYFFLNSVGRVVIKQNMTYIYFFLPEQVFAVLKFDWPELSS